MAQNQNTNGNGKAVGHREQETATLTPLTDNSSFQNLLDPQKFEHMWRVAKAFAASGMVPKMYDQKPEACFVATQMAVRLEVDPFMFMQNTYPSPDGKPAMEGKLAIALVNARGPFTGPIQYELSGQGDEYGCTAYAYDKRTGDMCSVRVTIGMAKAEGWYNRNAKWKNVPDLMLRYRAGAWLGRVYAPETLMGLQTVEEVVDVHGTLEKQSDGSYRPGRAQQRVTSELIRQQANESDDPATAAASKMDRDVARRQQDIESGEPAGPAEPESPPAPEPEPEPTQQPADEGGAYPVSDEHGEILGEYTVDQAEGAFRSMQSVIKNASDPQRAYDINSAVIRGLHDAGAEDAAAWDHALRKAAKNAGGGEKPQAKRQQRQAPEQGSLT